MFIGRDADEDLSDPTMSDSLFFCAEVRGRRSLAFLFLGKGAQGLQTGKCLFITRSKRRYIIKMSMEQYTNDHGASC